MFLYESSRIKYNYLFGQHVIQLSYDKFTDQKWNHAKIVIFHIFWQFY